METVWKTRKMVACSVFGMSKDMSDIVLQTYEYVMQEPILRSDKTSDWNHVVAAKQEPNCIVYRRSLHTTLNKFGWKHQYCLSRKSDVTYDPSRINEKSMKSS